MAESATITEEQRDKMENLSLGILDLCDRSGLNNGLLIVNAVLLGCAGVIASTLPEGLPADRLAKVAEEAGTALAQEIISGQQRFLTDMAGYAARRN